MLRFRKLLLPLLIVAALSLVAAVPAMAQVLPPAVYLCTVYEGGDLVGAGKEVAAFVGTEAAPRAMAETSGAGQALIQFAVTGELLGAPLRFEVNGYAATETPNVDVSVAGLDVRLDYTIENGEPPPNGDDDDDEEPEHPPAGTFARHLHDTFIKPLM